MIERCVGPLLVLVLLLLLPHALSRRTRMMPGIRANLRPCRLHEFIDCLSSLYAMVISMTRSNPPKDSVDDQAIFFCYHDTCCRYAPSCLLFPPFPSVDSSAR